MRGTDFGKVLEDLGYTQAMFSRLVHRDQNTVGKWVNGTTEVPNQIWLIIRLIMDLTPAKRESYKEGVRKR